MAEQHVPEWYTIPSTTTVDVTYQSASSTQSNNDPTVIIALDGYSTEILAGAGNVEILSGDDGEVPNEYWYDDIDPYQISTEDDVDQAIAEQVDRIKTFIAKLERVGPTDYGRGIIDDLTESISESNLQQSKEALMEYLDEEDEEGEITNYTVCNGNFNRVSGLIEHHSDCSVHGKLIEF